MAPSVTASGMDASNCVTRRKVHLPSGVRTDSKGSKVSVQIIELLVLVVTSVNGKHYAFEVSALSYAGMVIVVDV